jgi:hypothetical protein
MSEQARQSLSVTLSQTADVYGSFSVTITLISPPSAQDGAAQAGHGPRGLPSRQTTLGEAAARRESMETLASGESNGSYQRWLATQREYRLLLERLKGRRPFQLKTH